MVFGEQEAKTIIRTLKNVPSAIYFAYLEAGGVAINQGPKLFVPTEEQFDSMCHVDLHMPISEFRSPFDVMVIRIPNEWRKAKCLEHKCDINRAPLHVLIRYRNKVGENPYVYGMLRYSNYENHYQFQHNLNFPDRTLEEAISVHIANDFDRNNPQFDGEVLYCREAFRSALNLCMLLTYYGCKTTGPIDPVRHKKHRKENSPRRFADFTGVQINQDVVIRRTENLPPPSDFTSPEAIDAEDLNKVRLWEVKPHWRRGHWRRKPGWQAYVEAGQKPPLTFVRPTLVRRDRLADGPEGSNAEYKIR